MGRKNIIIFYLFIPILLVYNNCSPSSGDLSGAAVLGSISETGGSQFKGHGDYEYFSSEPACKAEKMVPSLVMNLTPAHVDLSVQNCSGESRRQVQLDELQFQAHNTQLVYYDGKIFAHPKLHQGVLESVHYSEFCFNSVLQMDFTIQYLKTYVFGVPTPFVDWVGVIMYGSASKYPGLHFNGGYMDTFLDGSKTFVANNGAYQVEFSDEYEPGKRSVLFKKKNGVVIPMQCWVQN